MTSHILELRENLRRITHSISLNCWSEGAAAEMERTADSYRAMIAKAERDFASKDLEFIPPWFDTKAQWVADLMRKDGVDLTGKPIDETNAIVLKYFDKVGENIALVQALVEGSPEAREVVTRSTLALIRTEQQRETCRSVLAQVATLQALNHDA